MNDGPTYIEASPTNVQIIDFPALLTFLSHPFLLFLTTYRSVASALLFVLSLLPPSLINYNRRLRETHFNWQSCHGSHWTQVLLSVLCVYSLFTQRENFSRRVNNKQVADEEDVVIGGGKRMRSLLAETINSRPRWIR